MFWKNAAAAAAAAAACDVLIVFAAAAELRGVAGRSRSAALISPFQHV
jgi:hypothetical protein